jgi:hypothetical protein
MFKILSTYICWKKYIKCNMWRVAVRPSYIEDAGFLKVKLYIKCIWQNPDHLENQTRRRQLKIVYIFFL